MLLDIPDSVSSFQKWSSIWDDLKLNPWLFYYMFVHDFRDRRVVPFTKIQDYTPDWFPIQVPINWRYDS